MNEPPETKTCHIGDILSVTTGVLVSPDHIGGVHSMLAWMVGESLMTHQLPRVARECAPLLREQFPDLAAIDMTDVKISGQAECIAWLAGLEPDFGTHREVPRLPTPDHTRIDPLAEIKMMRPDATIVIVEVPPHE